ncbi:MAG: hypothetical protein ACK55Z_15345, partial [bacterium]
MPIGRWRPVAARPQWDRFGEHQPFAIGNLRSCIFQPPINEVGEPIADVKRVNAPQLLSPPLSFSVRQNSRHVGYVGRNEQHGSHIGLVSLRDMRLEQH